jgi:hypothetical protein
MQERGTAKIATLLALVATAIVVLGAVVAANAQVIRVGNLILTADGGFAPQALPKHENAPITIHGGGSISTVNGEDPPVLENINIEFDRHGSVETIGLPQCTEGKLEATTTPQARKSCPGAIVGKGSGHAIVKFPEQGPIPVTSPITIFNGPTKHGNPTVYAHAYTTVPVATTFIVPIVIEKIHKGVYGYRTKAKIPRIANGYGIPISGKLTIGKKWTFKGQKHSYINARCETGHLQARVEATFKTGDFLSGVFIRTCKVRG